MVVNTAITAVQNALPTSYVGGSVYLDSNGNGTKDDVEGGISAATVTLYEDSDRSKDFSLNYDELIQKTTTNDSGGYSFYHTPEGVYFIELSTSSLGLESPIVRPNNPRSATVYEDNGFKSTGFDFFAARESAPVGEETETDNSTPQSNQNDEEGNETQSQTEEQDTADDNESEAAKNVKKTEAMDEPCTELSLSAIENQTDQLNQFTADGQQDITFAGSTCADEKLLASYQGQDIVVIADSDGFWTYTLTAKELAHDSSITFQLARNTDLSLTVRLFLTPTNTIEKISTFVSEDVGVFIQDLDQNLRQTTGLNLKIMISILVLLLFFWFAYRLLLKKYFRRENQQDS